MNVEPDTRRDILNSQVSTIRNEDINERGPMNDSANESVRIQPPYNLSGEPLEPCVFSHDATLSQNDVCVPGCFEITLNHATMRQRWAFVADADSIAINEDSTELTEAPLDAIEPGKVQVKVGNHTLTFEHSGYNALSTDGVIAPSLELGTPQSLDRVVFYLPNCPTLSGCSRSTLHTDENGRRTHTTWQEVVFGGAGWSIALQPPPGASDMRWSALMTRTHSLATVGQITRSDGSHFNVPDVNDLLEALRFFLSFAFGKWMPPLLAVGFHDGKEVWRQFRNCDVSDERDSRGWLNPARASRLESAFAGFMKLWNQHAWRETLQIAISWLVESTRLAGGVEGAIAMAQIPLERLVWMVLVHDKRLSKRKFKGLGSACEQFHEMLRQLRIPTCVPSDLPTLQTVANRQRVEHICRRNDTPRTTGPQIATKVRNTVIHPDTDNTKLLEHWEKKYHVSAREIRRETYRLFNWYTTLVLLWKMDYQGKYVPRLTPYKLSNRDPLVPWADGADVEDDE